MDLYYPAPKCNGDCVIPLTRDYDSTIGSFKRCPHGVIYICVMTYSIGIAGWRRLHPFTDFKLYRTAKKQLS